MKSGRRQFLEGTAIPLSLGLHNRPEPARSVATDRMPLILAGNGVLDCHSQALADGNVFKETMAAVGATDCVLVRFIEPNAGQFQGLPVL